VVSDERRGALASLPIFGIIKGRRLFLEVQQFLDPKTGLIGNCGLVPEAGLLRYGTRYPSEPECEDRWHRKKQTNNVFELDHLGNTYIFQMLRSSGTIPDGQRITRTSRT